MDAGERRGGASAGGAAEDELRGRPSWLLLDKPVPLRATWASSFPDHLRLTKRWEMFPLALELSADYDVAAQALSARASVKVSEGVLGGCKVRSRPRVAAARFMRGEVVVERARRSAGGGAACVTHAGAVPSINCENGLCTHRTASLAANCT